jgi:hypothetical protein
VLGGVDAIIFADGHTEGNPQQVKKLYMQRRGAYRALGEIIALLDAIVSKGEATQHIADILDHRSKALVGDLSIDGYQKSGMVVISPSLKGPWKIRKVLCGFHWALQLIVSQT